MNNFIIVGALLLLANFLPIQGTIYLDLDLESIVIDDSLKTVDIDDGEYTTVVPEEGSCVTTAGFQGTCIPLNECYPYASELMKIQAEDNDIEGFYLLNIINATEPCPQDGLVCCQSSNLRLSTKKPSVLPQFPTPTTGKPIVSSTEKSNQTKTPAPVNKGKSACGNVQYKSVDQHCVGCNEARKHQFPWAVALLNGGRQFCGGSLISENFILTAAHCVASTRSTQGMTVSLGDHDVLSSSEVRHESRTISKILYHRGFSMNHLQNDVALIQLSSPVKFSPQIQPVCLNSETVTYPGKVTLAGWGKTSSSGGPSRVLRWTAMPLITPVECKQIYQGTRAPQLTKGMICAGQRPPNAVKDACNGDSGGPLTEGDGSKTEGVRQYGIVSWGIGCGDKPGVYTNVAEYLPWITKNSK